MVYVEHDINSKHKDVLAQVKDKLVFVVEDACQSDMFTKGYIAPEDLIWKQKYWVALVNWIVHQKIWIFAIRARTMQELGLYASNKYECEGGDRIAQTLLYYKCLRHEKVLIFQVYIQNIQTRTETKSF